MNLSESLQKYLDDISSNSPTPGGGNVSAFAGAAACSLGIMVCNLTIGKKKYLEVEDEMKELKSKLETYKEEFLTLSQMDNEAFEKVMQAFKMPKETDEEKKLRSEEIDKATIAAAVVPSKVIIAAGIILPLLEKISKKGNQNSVSDAGVAVSLAQTAAQGAYLNVLINCSALNGNEAASELLKSSLHLLNEIKTVAESILKDLTKSLSN